MLPAGQKFTLLSSWFVAELPSHRSPATGGEQDHGTQPLLAPANMKMKAEEM